MKKIPSLTPKSFSFFNVSILFFISLFFINLSNGSTKVCNDFVSHILTILKSRALVVNFPEDPTIPLGANPSSARRASWNALQALHSWGVLQQASVSELRAGIALIPRGSQQALLVKEVTKNSDNSRQILLSMIPTSEVKAQPDPTSRIDRWILRSASRGARAIRRFLIQSDPDVFLVTLSRGSSTSSPFRELPQQNQAAQPQRPYLIHSMTLIHPERVLLSSMNSLVMSASFSPDGSRIITSSEDKTAKIWDTQSGNLLHNLTAHRAGVFSASFSPNGTRFITTSHDNTAKIWNTQSGVLLQSLTGLTTWVSPKSFSPDGTHIVLGYYDGTAKIWDAQSGSLLQSLTGHRNRIFSAEFSTDGSRIITSSEDKTAKIWDTRTGNLLHSLTAHTDGVFFASFSPDDAHVATISHDGLAKIWNPQTGELLKSFGESIQVSSLFSSPCFSPDGSSIALAYKDNTVKIWDTQSGVLLQSLEGHRDLILSLSFSADGSRIITTSEDKTAKIWDTRTGALLQSIEGHSNGVLSASFSPDGSRIITTSFDNTAKIWAVSPYIAWEQE